MSSSNALGTPFLELLTVDSTNNYAMGLVRAGMAHHGTAVFTKQQTHGKGQRDKTWVSEPDQNIAITVILEPGMPASSLFLLSMAIAVGTFRFFSKYVPDDVRIKWPNDLYWRDRKAGGILIENVWQGSHWNYAIVGIGININQTDFGSLPAVSLKQITGNTFDPAMLAKELCSFLDASYEEVIKKPSKTKEVYTSNLYKHGERVKLKKGSRIFQATIEGVNTAGQLVVKHVTEECFDVGEVEWLNNL